jgi:hypothetical protein
MKKRLYFISTVLLAVTALSLSSCLKDPRYVDFSKAGNVVNMPFSGNAYFGSDAITESPADDENGTIVRQFSVNVATANPPTTDTKITLAVDKSLVATYNALGGPVTYDEMPDDAYSFTTTEVTVPSGKQFAVTSITFYKNLLDPSKSYMLPVKIVSTTGGYTISGNLGVHYFHFIGNDFAGLYEHFYTRWEKPDTLSSSPSTDRGDEGPDVFNPVTPTEFTVITDYYTAPRYDVTFTKTGTGASATYSNFQVQFLPEDIAAGGTWATNITVVNQPSFNPADFKTNPYDPTKEYTFAESLKLFRIYFTTATRSIRDEYVKL